MNIKNAKQVGWVMQRDGVPQLSHTTRISKRNCFKAWRSIFSDYDFQDIPRAKCVKGYIGEQDE